MFKHSEPQRTYRKHTTTELALCGRVLLHYFGVVQAQRTYTNLTKLTSTELARCVGCLCTSSGWFKHSEPLRTYTNHTLTELARCVGCFCTRGGGSSTANLHEPHHHRASKVCRVLRALVRVVQAQRTYTNHTITVLARCVGCLCTSSGWFKHMRTYPEPSARMHTTLRCVATLCRVCSHVGSGWLEAQFEPPKYRTLHFEPTHLAELC